MAEKHTTADSRYLLFPGVFLGGFITSSAMLPLWMSQVTGTELLSPAFLDAANNLTHDVVAFLSDSSSVLLCFAVVTFFAVAIGLFLHRTSDSACDREISGDVEAQPLVSNEKIELAGVKLSDELTEILGIIEAYVTVNDSYSASLEKVEEKLPRRISPDQVRQVVRTLVTENQKFREHSAELRDNLQHSKAQIEVLREELNEAQQEGLRDALTQIGNRRLFDKTLAREVQNARTNETHLSLVLTDIDRFKTFNDTYGHQVGDEVLKVFAELMTTNTKGQDTVARYGGEEFAIILPRTDTGNAYQLVEQIRRELESKRHEIKKTGERVSKVTASFGIAKFRDDDTIDSLIARADAKLYQAKGNGRNCIVVDNSSSN